MIRICIVLFCSIFIFPSLTISQIPLVSSEDASMELDSMVTAIKFYHPNPYRYISEEKWDIEIHQAKERMLSNDSISLFHFRKEAQTLAAMLKDEHLKLSLQDEIWTNLRSKHLFFPFEVDEINGELVTRKTSNPSFSEWENLKIISINGIRTGDIIDNIKYCTGSCSSSNLEGSLYHATSFDNFSRIYFLCVDQSTSYEVSFENGTTEIFEGIPDPMKEEDSDLFRFMEQGPVFVKYADSSAYIRISSFYPDIYGDNLNKAKKKIDAIFEELNKRNIRHLFIDIQGNRGGTPFYSTHVAGFLFEQPFQPFDKVYVSRHAAKDFPKKFKAERKTTIIEGSRIALLKKRLAGFETKHPDERLFKGKVTVLIDGGSGSASGIFCGIAAKNEHVSFWGEETMGDANQMTGGQFVHIRFEHTKTVLSLPLLIFSYGDDSPVYGTKPSQGIDEELLKKFDAGVN